MIYRAAAATCPGKKKSYNSNNFYLNSKYITEEFCSSQVLLTQKKDQKGLQLYAISEGFGADTYSEEASLIAVKNMFKFHGKKLQELAAAREAGKSTTGMDMVGFVNTYIQSTNHMIKAKASTLGDDQLRATLAMICVKGKRVVTANLGNTRIYHFRNGLLQQISEDHTQAQVMVDSGMLTPDRAASHPKRHKLTQYFGIHSDKSPLNPAVFEMTAEAGDVFLICSHAFSESITAED
ncbi:MAG: protein phosphatase 2C domain-containing protein, partial [Clostridia bacterium]|nr:protein phosphatase 2C domain-containing protein [Clostridia bacterium]